MFHWCRDQDPVSAFVLILLVGIDFSQEQNPGSTETLLVHLDKRIEENRERERAARSDNRNGGAWLSRC